MREISARMKPVIQEEIYMQSLVPGTQHQKDRYYNVIDIDKQSCHERTIEELLSSELKACQHIRCRKSQDQKKCKSQRCHNERVQEEISPFLHPEMLLQSS